MAHNRDPGSLCERCRRCAGCHAEIGGCPVPNTSCVIGREDCGMPAESHLDCNESGLVTHSRHSFRRYPAATGREPEDRQEPSDDGSKARKVVRLDVEYVRKETVEFDFPDFASGMANAGWGEHAVGVMLRQMWVQAYGQRASMGETVNFQRWHVVELCDQEHQGYEYDHGPWERVPKSDSLSVCTRCGKRSGK